VPPDTRDVLFEVVAGIGLIVVGLGDHRLILRSLQPVAHV
jgi:hypothetical protein